MGTGSWDSSRYYSGASSRKASGVDDFAYDKIATDIHDSLKPKRINDKPFGKLESRDNADHPDSNAIIFAMDVTGSNKHNAVLAQKALPALMTLLVDKGYIPDPQIAVFANDDFRYEPDRCIQASDFESDNRIDDHIRNLKLVGNGGGNHQESYDLLLYLAARKTVIDCLEERGRKGYMFMYADEPVPTMVSKEAVKRVFGDSISEDISIETIIEEVKDMYHLFVLWPIDGYQDARDQYVQLFGEDHVISLQHPNIICQQIGSLIGMNEKNLTPSEVEDDLVSVGMSAKDARAITQALMPFAKGGAARGLAAKLPGVGKTKGGATRL